MGEIVPKTVNVEHNQPRSTKNKQGYKIDRETCRRLIFESVTKQKANRVTKLTDKHVEG